MKIRFRIKPCSPRRMLPNLANGSRLLYKLKIYLWLWQGSPDENSTGSEKETLCIMPKSSTPLKDYVFRCRRLIFPRFPLPSYQRRTTASGNRGRSDGGRRMVVRLLPEPSGSRQMLCICIKRSLVFVMAQLPRRHG